VQAIAIDAGTDISDLVGSLGISGSAAAIASIAALATVVTAIATEAGLGNASCRDKVGGICGTDSNAWEGLLAGLVAIGVAFSLKDIVDAANTIFDDAASLIQAAA
jgi:hypothetical protein